MLLRCVSPFEEIFSLCRMKTREEIHLSSLSLLTHMTSANFIKLLTSISECELILVTNLTISYCDYSERESGKLK